MPAARVLEDIRALGLDATEAGPPGFLPADPLVARATAARFGLRIIGGFVTAVLHEPAARRSSLAAIERQVRWLADAGAEVLVLAPAGESDGYDARARLDDAAWRELFATLPAVDALAARSGLALTVHPHFGTAIETAADIDRFVEGCEIALCLDTGHVALGGADPAAIAARTPGRVRHVHLKDVDSAIARRIRARELGYAEGVRQGLYRPLGTGAARIEAVIAALGPGYGGWFVLEQDVALADGSAATPAEWVRQSLEFVRARA